MKKSFLVSFIISSLIFLILFFLSIFITRDNFLLLGARILWAVLLSLAAFFIFRTGKISFWRAIIFILIALGFLIEFKSSLIGLRGTAFYTDQIQEVPFCHIAIASTLLNFIYNQYLAITSGNWGIWGPLSLGFLWLIVTFTVGQGWCSWVCFYGGYDECFSRIRRKPLFKFSLPKKLRDFPAALLIFLLLASLTAGVPIFCLWLCPLKITTAFLDPSSTIAEIQLFLFVIIGVVFLIILPLLTKKRTFCGLICPFGAWQSFFGQISPYRVTINPEKCIQCKKCLEACPILSIDDKSLEAHKISSYCNKCGECIDICPTKAINFTILNKFMNEPVKKSIISEFFNPYTLFIFISFLVTGAVSNCFVPNAIVRIIKAVIGAGA